MKRILALLLCLAALLTMPAAALASCYSYVSDTGDKLVFPSSKNFYETAFPATVKTENCKSIYIMPKPETGHGTLGTIAKDAEVTILAEEGGYFFFVTADGWYGWNGMSMFSYDEAAAKGARASWRFPVESDREELVLPEEDDYCRKPFVLFATDGVEKGAIYLMPQPEAGHGEIGRVRTGNPVLILAQHNGFYFFRTLDGRYGWNGMGWFREKMDA